MSETSNKNNLTPRILIAMSSGALIGLLFHYIPIWFFSDGNPIFDKISAFVLDGVLEVGGYWFIASLKMLVVPLVFVSLVCGICSIGGSARIGSISVKTIGFYLLTTAMAISLALIVSNIIDPGEGNLEEIAPAEGFEPKESPGLVSVLKGLVPTNVILAMANGKMLQVIFYAVLFGVGLAKLGDKVSQVRSFFVELDKIIMQLVMTLMHFAPYGVFCLIAAMFANSGFADILKLLVYFFCVLLVLFLHTFLSYGSLLWLFTRLNPVTFYKKMGQLWAFGFSTASSGATIPLTLKTVEHKLGVKNEVASFTVPLGATINMDGTAIMQGVATVFISQYFNIDLSFSDYLLVILTATLASVGTAAVPGVGLITLAMVLEQVGLPVEGIALIIGVDRILDMVRTAVNITGDSVVSIIVAKSEGMFDEKVYLAKKNDMQTD